jgi:hypothetical protein
MVDLAINEAVAACAKYCNHERVGAVKGSPSLVCWTSAREAARDLVARVTEQERESILGAVACERSDHMARISTLEGLLREAVACVEIVERRDMGGQEWLDARRLRLRIEAELAGKGEADGE